MRCPYCRFGDSRVTDSREIGGLIRRRRECPECHQRFTTHERLAGLSLSVVKRDGRREPFDREKLLRGLRFACAKRPVPTADLEWAAETIELGLFARGESEVSSERIGEIALDALSRIDAIAYIRFASVLRQIPDMAALRRAIDGLEASISPLEKVPSIL